MGFSQSYSLHSIRTHNLIHFLKKSYLTVSFIYSGYFYSVFSSPLLLRGAPDTAWILCQNFTPKRHRQLWAKGLPTVPTRCLERKSNPWPFGRKAPPRPTVCDKVIQWSSSSWPSIQSFVIRHIHQGTLKYKIRTVYVWASVVSQHHLRFVSWVLWSLLF